MPTPSLSAVPFPIIFTQATLIDRHETGWITSAELTRNSGTTATDGGHRVCPYQRLSMATQSGQNAYCHRVQKKNDASDRRVTNRQDCQVSPVGFVHRIPHVNDSHAAYLLRWWYFTTKNSGFPGKLIELEGGRGWAGDGFRFSSDATSGSDGWGANAMHGEAGSENRLRMLARLADMRPEQGEFGTGGRMVGPLLTFPENRWIVIDQLAILKGNPAKRGYRYYQDGREVCNVLGEMPARNPGKCNTLNIVHRHMHGGNPDELLAKHNYEEFFCNFEVFALD